MAPKYKLTYFNFKALAEPIRMILSYANQEFEDVRVEREDWPALKPQMPWNVMPVLEVDGQQLSQSTTIVRYLGKKHGLAPSDEFQAAKCDEYVDAIVDVRVLVSKVFTESDEAKKTEIKKNAKENAIPNAWKKFNEILKKNGTGFLVGKKETYSDIYVAFMVEFISAFFEFDLQDYPELREHQKKVFALPGIADWIKKRPATQF